MKKDTQFDAHLAAACPPGYRKEASFTDRVMKGIVSNEIMSSQIRKMDVNKKETLFMKFRHLPKFAVVAIAIGAAIVLGGTTYAIVQTVIKQSNVTLDSSAENEFGREELHVTFDSCEEQKKRGTTYELKQDSGLSAEDGAKVLEARCEIDAVANWVEHDEQSKRMLDGVYSVPGQVMSFFPQSVRKIESISDNSIKFERDEAPFPSSGRVVINNEVAGREVLKPGDSVFYFNPSFRIGRGGTPATTPSEGIVVFKLALDKRYYSLDLQSYVKTRSACRENPSLTCLKASNINHVTLIVTRGGYNPETFDGTPQRELQGQVKEYTDTSITLDVGGGKLYTIHTPRNIIQKYNASTVYGLAALDTIYSKTNPEELKIKTGDILEINYSEQAGIYSTDILWERLGVISLMVERTVKDISVLRKY